MKLRLGIFSALVALAALWLFSGSGQFEAGTPPDAAEARPGHLRGGCFWCLETAFEAFPGLLGDLRLRRRPVEEPSYEQVSSGGTGTPSRCRSPTTGHGELRAAARCLLEKRRSDGCGASSATAAANTARDLLRQRRAEARGARLEERPRVLGPHREARVTQVVALEPSTCRAYHQDFYKKDPIRYKTYRLGCGAIGGSNSCGASRTRGRTRRHGAGRGSGTKGWQGVKEDIGRSHRRPSSSRR